MSALVEGMLCPPGGNYGTMVTQVWTHMVRVAPIARRVGRVSGVMPEASYTLGLLHDLRKLIVFDRLSALRNNGRHTFRFPRLFLRVALEQLHGPLGGLAAVAWGMDPDAVRAIASHQRTDLRYDGEKLWSPATRCSTRRNEAEIERGRRPKPIIVPRLPANRREIGPLGDTEGWCLHRDDQLPPCGAAPKARCDRSGAEVKSSPGLMNRSRSIRYCFSYSCR